MTAIADLLSPYVLRPLPEAVLIRLETYLDLLLKWNARTNLTSIRDRDTIVRRHFGESLFLGQHLPAFTTLLDFGTGAGFPGVPIQLLYPQCVVTLAESQGKKASFLREVVRVLELPSEVFSGRVETMPERSIFDIVTMRAVDGMQEALPLAAERVRQDGTLALLLGREADRPHLEKFQWKTPYMVPGNGGSALLGVKSNEMFHVEHSI